MRRIIWLGLLVAVVVGGWWLAKLIWFRPLKIDHFFTRVFLKRVLEDPQLLSELGILEPYGIRFHQAKLSDASDAFRRRQLERCRRELQVLRSYDRSRLTPSQRLSADILDWYLDREIREEPFLDHNYPVNQMFGIQSETPSFLIRVHQIAGKRDAENYLRRLHQIGWQFGQVADGLKARETRGIIPPTFVIEKVLAQMRDFIAGPVTNNVLYTSFGEKLAKAPGLSDADKDGLLRRARRDIETTVYPSYRVLIGCCESMLRQSTRDAGVWKFPDGAEFYREELRAQTTTTMTPADVHALGIREVARIETEMRTVLASLGDASPTVAAALRRLTAETGETNLLAEYRQILKVAKQAVTPVFDIRPRGALKVERVPEFKERTAPAAYYVWPAVDGSRPGIFYVNLFPVAATPRFEMKTLACHEGIPGHHFQTAIQQELRDVPVFRRFVPFTAYSEGWALYAERLAAECGLYRDDPKGNLGRLSMELLRAARLVVDTGLHYKRWSREQAMQYMEDHLGSPFEGEIDRYIVSPGQACAYKIGELKILELRERAKTQLGDRFDLREFHNVILQNGAMPLEILERVVDQSITSRTSR